MLRTETGEVFATGACTYDDVYPADAPGNIRLVILVQCGANSTPVAVDTGGMYFILDPEWAAEIGYDADPLDRVTIYSRGRHLRGTLSRCAVTLLAQTGQSQQVEVTAFLPDWDGQTPWDIPAFFGLRRCLDAFRFAVDPARNLFYFGPLFPEGD